MPKELDEYQYIKLEDGDPRQCERPGCKLVVVEGSKYCIAHGGRHAAERAEKQRMRNYNLAKFHQRANELSESKEITSLRDEVGLLRLLIESKINHCKDTTDLLLISGPLSDLLMKSERLVTSMEKLESKMGHHLDKSKIVQIAQSMIDIISRYIDNPEVLDAIGEDFFKTIETL
jgi:hypothetical protein